MSSGYWSPMSLAPSWSINARAPGRSILQKEIEMSLGDFDDMSVGDCERFRSGIPEIQVCPELPAFPQWISDFVTDEWHGISTQRFKLKTINPFHD